MRSLAFAVVALLGSSALAAGRPNVLWVISEDTGPEIGCYGDDYAVTPNIDRLAGEGLRYTFCWSNAPVCAPARTTLISGMYPTSTGAEHMRSLVSLPAGMKMFPQYLREAGYFTANWKKEDFNLEKPGTLWAVENETHPWRKRAEGQPFFAIFNIQTSHESQIRKRPHELKHEPAKARVPAYHPDAPEVRRDWAQYYDKVTEMDAEVGAILARLEADGLKEETIVFYFGDHGSGMPRHKRWPFDSGLHVPLVIRIPEAHKELRPADYAAGGTTDRLVSFVDFGATALSLAGVETPDYYQGSAFLGPHAGEPNAFLHGFRGRMDERIDCVRSVTDGRYVYVRHYMPHRIYGQHVGYMFETPTTATWKRLFDEGKLNEAQSAFWREKPGEELFDLASDPDEVRSAAGSPDGRMALGRLRRALREHALRVRDVGLLPEAEMHVRCEEFGVTPYELGHDEKRYPLERVLETAEMASRGSKTDPSDAPDVVKRFDDPDAAVRYWAVNGLLVRGVIAYREAADAAPALLDDPSPSVRIAASELVCRFGRNREIDRAAEVLIDAADFRSTNQYAATQALLVLDELLTAKPELIKPHTTEIEALPLPAGKGVNPRAKEYPGRLKEWITGRLAGAE